MAKVISSVYKVLTPVYYMSKSISISVNKYVVAWMNAAFAYDPAPIATEYAEVIFA